MLACMACKDEPMPATSWKHLDLHFVDEDDDSFSEFCIHSSSVMEFKRMWIRSDRGPGGNLAYDRWARSSCALALMTSAMKSRSRRGGGATINL
jgi:hypothetical protein